MTSSSRRGPARVSNRLRSCLDGSDDPLPRARWLLPGVVAWVVAIFGFACWGGWPAVLGGGILIIAAVGLLLRWASWTS